MAVFKIVHLTKYQYSWPVKESINEVRMFPHHFENQEVLQFQMLITGNPAIDLSEDYYGNRVGNFNLLQTHTEMNIETRMLVRVNHSLKIPNIDQTTVADIESEKQKSIMLLRLCYPDVIEKQKEIYEILAKIGVK